jgi:1-acyl-sn-glycerol-3-phosphate acyltransferase
MAAALPVLGLARLVVHLAVGLAKVALLFPFLSTEGRERRVQRWSRQLVAICGVALRIDASQQAHPASPALIVCNHISWLDIFVINTLHPCRFVAKSDIRSWPLIGWLCEHTGTIFIARGKARDVRRIYEGLVKSIHDGERVAFFPEGTTSPQGTVLPFHANLLQAAIATATPIQPAVLRFADAQQRFSPAVAYVGDTTLLQSLWRVATARGLVAHVDLLPPQGSAHADRRALAEHLRQDMAAQLAS